MTQTHLFTDAPNDLSTGASPVASNPALDKKPSKAIYVNLKLVKLLEDAIGQGMNEYETLPPRKELLDDVVSQMIKALYVGNDELPYFYYKGHVSGKDSNYKWFDSEIVDIIQQLPGIRNKGAWVDALLLMYLYGERAKGYITTLRRIQPRQLTSSEIRELRLLAEMPAAEDVESTFDPTTFEGEIPGPTI